MRNNMENLVGRKVKCVKRYRNITEKKEYEIKSVNERTFEITEDDGTNDTWNIEWIKGYDEDGEYHFELLPNEPQFKQGDKVLWSGVKSKDKIGIFICEYENYFIVKHIGDEYGLENGKLKYAEKIRPYEDEIKVGDWVKHNDFITKHTKEMAGHWIKITNPELIKLLNNEL